jgi:hypothetical protein
MMNDMPQMFELETMPVHPLADLFPLMPDDELVELADDIKAHGLRNALVRDPQGQLLDGRNRLKACEMVGVLPRFETYEGDPIAFIWSINDRRRHMTKGQRAMVEALADPEGHQGQQLHVKNTEVNANYLSRARTVRRHAPDLVEGVRIGKVPLAEAYEVARRNKEASESAEAAVARLHEQAPDLAALYDEDKLKLSEALAAIEQRRSEEITRSRAATNNLARIYSSLHPRETDPGSYAAMMFGPTNLKFWTAEDEPLTTEGLLQCAAVLKATADLLKKGRIS